MIFSNTIRSISFRVRSVFLFPDISTKFSFTEALTMLRPSEVISHFSTFYEIFMTKFLALSFFTYLQQSFAFTPSVNRPQMTDCVRLTGKLVKRRS